MHLYVIMTLINGWMMLLRIAFYVPYTWMKMAGPFPTACTVQARVQRRSCKSILPDLSFLILTPFHLKGSENSVSVFKSSKNKNKIPSLIYAFFFVISGCLFDISLFFCVFWGGATFCGGGGGQRFMQEGQARWMHPIYFSHLLVLLFHPTYVPMYYIVHITES